MFILTNNILFSAGVLRNYSVTIVISVRLKWQKRRNGKSHQPEP